MLPDPPPPLESDPPVPEPDDENLARLDANGRFAGIVALAFVSPLLIDLLAFGVIMESMSPFLGMLLGGFVAVKLVLLALWVAWGSSRLIVRLLVVGVSVAITSMIGGRMEWSNVWAFTFIMVLAIAAVLALPRIAGARWVTITPYTGMVVPPGALLPPRATRDQTRNSRQFSLFDIFLWTTTAACLFGVFRLVEIDNDFLRFAVPPMAIYTASGGLTMLFYMWAMLGDEGTPVGRFWIAWIVSCAIGLLLGLLAQSGAGFYLSLFVAFYSGIALGCLAILRATGARFVWHERGG